MENRKYSLTETLVGLVFMVAVLFGAFYLFKGLFKILSFAAPIMFIAALLINHKVVLSYGKLLVNLLQKNVVTGIIVLLLTFFAFPIVSAILLGLAVMNKKAENIMTQEKQRREGIPTDFRELSSTPKERNQYDDLIRKS